MLEWLGEMGVLPLRPEKRVETEGTSTQGQSKQAQLTRMHLENGPFRALRKQESAPGRRKAAGTQRALGTVPSTPAQGHSSGSPRI